MQQEIFFNMEAEVTDSDMDSLPAPGEGLSRREARMADLDGALPLAGSEAIGRSCNYRGVYVTYDDAHQGSISWKDKVIKVLETLRLRKKKQKQTA